MALTTRLEIVTIERQVYSAEVRMVVAPGVEGELGILPRHAPVITLLQPGELRITTETGQESFVIGGGILEVLPDRVLILADSVEAVDEIDIARAEEARRRAEVFLREHPAGEEQARMEGALRRSNVRLKVAQRRRQRPSSARATESSE
ncbi:MAG: F0F1 ATP synthase subunit epsilon [Chloroflexi bacterium]|nr:F0F1 ATP synthase subunit epsilon [Chloroflexota bacterium]